MSRQKIRSLREDVLSGSSTRSPSRARTPNPDGEENASLDVNFLNIEELLASKLESLESLLSLPGKPEFEPMEKRLNNDNRNDYKQKTISELNKSRIQSDLTTINQIVASLLRPRTEVSSESREVLLAQLYKLVAMKPIVVYNEEHGGTKDFVSESTVESLLNIFYAKDYRSSSELLLLYRSIIALLVSDLDEFGDLANTQLLSYIEKLVSDSSGSLMTNENKASTITGYCGLLLVLYNGTSAYGVDAKINWLFELAQGFVESATLARQKMETGDREYSTLMHENADKQMANEQEAHVAEEVNVAIAAIHGCGVLLTLLPRGQFLNELLADLTSKLVEILDTEDEIEMARAAARVIALCYELFSYEEDEDAEDDQEYNYNAPYYEQSALLAICDRLASLSSKKIGKKVKQETHTTFAETSNTINTYTDPEKRLEIYKKSPDGVEIANKVMSSTHIKLSKSKSLPINSWFLYFRCLHLKWCFGFGLHSQLTCNDEIKQILKEPSTEYQEKYNFDPSSQAAESGGYRSANALTDAERFAQTDKKRSNDLKKARVNKVTEEMDELHILEKDQ